VLPVDEEVARDLRDSTFLLVVLALVLFVGGLVTINFARWLGIALTVTGVVLGVFVGLRYGRSARSTDSGRPIPEIDQSREADLTPAMLDYASRPKMDSMGMTSISAFQAGFFLVVGIGVGSYLSLIGLMAAFPRGHSDWLRRGITVIVVAAMIGLIIGAYRVGKTRWPGFGRGVMIGLIVYAVVLGPCAVGVTGALIFG
jgi:hypothetical protein